MNPTIIIRRAANGDWDALSLIPDAPRLSAHFDNRALLIEAICGWSIPSPKFRTAVEYGIEE
jgi:hypothetical protein